MRLARGVVAMFMACALCGAGFALPDPHAPIPAAAEGMTWGPYLVYTGPESAVVTYETSHATPSVVHYGPRGGTMATARSVEAVTRHQVTLTGLKPSRVYDYFIETRVGEAESTSQAYDFDTTFNYTPEPIPDAIQPYRAEHAARCAAAAEKMLALSGVDRGYCVVLGGAEGCLALEIARRSGLQVLSLDTDPETIARGRKLLCEAGVYGVRVTLRRVDSLADTGLTANYANLVVSERALFEEAGAVTMPVMRSLLDPNGAAVLGTVDGGQEAGWETAHGVMPAGAGAWTHQYGDAANTANSQDTLSGATATGELAVQWLGRPGGDFGVDRNPRMPAPLFSQGRLFHQGLNRMVALDAYNGAILWLAEAPGLRRVNVPRDASNWCADDTCIYVAVQDRCWQVDAATGDVRRTYVLPDQAGGRKKDWGYVARAEGLLLGSSVLEGSSYRKYFGGDAWYDQKDGPGTYKVCSESVHAYDPATGALQWSYKGGAVINTTICAGYGRVMFVESRHPKLAERETGRIGESELWLEQYLVSLNAATGVKQWEQPIDTEDGITVFYGIQTEDRYMLESSLNGAYHLVGYNTADGALAWHAGHKWLADNHSGHMMHPVVVGENIFLEPMGYEVASGRQVTDKVGRREGCSTYAGTKYALVYRGEDRRVSMWDIDSAQVTSWPNLRPSCWLSVIPSGGMILAPEGGAGCSCGGWIETSLGFTPGQFVQAAGE